MGTKAVHDDVLDGLLDYVKQNTTRQTVCGSYPTSYAQANASYALASATVASGDFTLANATSGRKVTGTQYSNQTITANGTARHLAYLKVASTMLLVVTTCSTQALSSGGTVTIPGWKINVQDPT